MSQPTKTRYATEVSRPAKSVAIRTFSVKEVSVEISADDLRSSAEGYDFLILKITGLTSTNGRPVVKSVRIHTDMLKDY